MHFHKVSSFVTGKLEKDLPRYLTYHSIHHTKEVVQHAKYIAEKEGIPGEEMDIILTAALFHDTGFIEAYKDHEDYSIAFAKKYLPEFGGYCANGVAYGIPWGGDADTWKMIDGKLYIFGGQASKDAFEVDDKKYLALAQKYWSEEIAGNNSFIQRSKRIVFKVPHYKNGDELAKMVADAKAKK